MYFFKTINLMNIVNMNRDKTFQIMILLYFKRYLMESIICADNITSIYIILKNYTRKKNY